uniref:Xylulose kinase-1 n=1 Tax=Tanacetum cinerariifolium TaxID=118510 RepID=A0A699GTD5_TANCI|nr:hypothetical protein [Tanacetum cinerariifolium]
MLKSFPLPVMKFPIPEYFPTASEEVFPLLSQRDALAEEVCTAEKLKVVDPNSQEQQVVSEQITFAGSACHERLCLRESHHLYYYYSKQRTHEFMHVYLVFASVYVWIRLVFCDYHNMIAVLEKYEHNVDFHQIVDFIEASHIRYALTINPTVYVFHIRQFWSTTRIETTDEGTKIPATVDGKLRTISESSIRRNLKLNDEEGISTLPDVELFENLALIGPKSTGFNKFSSNITTAVGEFNTGFHPMVDFIATSPLRYALTVKPTIFVSHIRQLWSTVRIETTDEGIHILATVDGIQRTMSESSLRRNLKLRDEDGISLSVHGEEKCAFSMGLGYGGGALRRLGSVLKNRRRPVVGNKMHKAFPLPDEPASPVRDVSEGEACPTESGFIAVQDRATIAKSSTLPHDSAPTVTSPVADEGKEEIVRLKERVQVLEDREGNTAKQSGDDALIKGRSINEGEVAAKRISNDSEAIARVLTSMDAATVLAGGIDVPTGSGSIPTASPPATIISIGSEVGPTASLIVTRRKNAEVARIHAKEELQGMIDSLDKSNETIAKYLQEYHEFASELPLEKRIELISDLVEDFIPMGSKEETERLKRKGLNLEKEQVKKQKSSEEAPETETSTEEFTEEKMKEMMQLVPVEDVYVQALQVKHPIIDWKVHTEGQRSYWQIIRLRGTSACYQFFVDLLKQLDREDMNQLWALVKEYLSIRPATCEKEMKLWVELKRMYEPDPEDQLWTLT